MDMYKQYWTLPFCDNKGAINPKFHISNKHLIITKLTNQHILLISVYAICSVILSIKLPLVLLTGALQIICMFCLLIGFFGFGFYYFKQVIIAFKVTVDNASQLKHLKLSHFSKSIPVNKIRALQVYPEDITKDAEANQQLFHCYALFVTKQGDNVRIGLFKNTNKEKHAIDCLTFATFCNIEIWEGCRSACGSVFTTEQKLENPTAISCFRLDGGSKPCC